ncbi:glutathione S-transferase [Pandoraea pnomenusa]|uniref:Putative glutathione S-transferase n=1 Tax=Pandoraea pnomenusa TaxID=93220 RepID=A0A378YGX5_9BURK|nr:MULTISPECIES: glutathione S-transferase [Pandoraea]AHB05098.2 glutathione S-transferase [Pandoraea pnomenusa 3kgm]AHB74528.1 glutathione S-transferase [Pandoraea pnomenusa]AHN77128.1 glutathione S-transferase [Pandoraea pnomenusa]AIU26336.1 glutathione S-transferase [Pandoraea pnomenusa]MBN9091968.1 glutathione S-transferase [Pandoraea pnomenusa]
MQLIGMLDSPYVRRVAICLKLLGLPYEHRSLSVFRTFDEFSAINPVVKAPTLVADDGTVLMDSTLILQYLESLVDAERRLVPMAPEARLRALRLTGLALAACEKSVQLVYERELRPSEKRHSPWTDRVRTQLHAAFQALELELAQVPLVATPDQIGEHGVTVAVAWRFHQLMLPEIDFGDQFPELANFSAQAEALPAFRETPPL